MLEQIRLVTTIAAVSLFSVSISAPSLAQTSGGPGDLRVGIDLTYPPYAYVENGVNTGFDVEMSALVGEVLGRSVAFSDTRFEQLILGLKSDRYDAIIASLYITRERAAEVDYIPYFMTGTSVLTRRDDERSIKTAGDLCGLQIASIKGAAVVRILSEEVAPTCTASGLQPPVAREFATDPEATLALISGNVDVQLTDAAVAQRAVEQTGDSLRIANDQALFPIPVGMAVNKGNEDMRKAIETALEALTADGRYAQLLDKYNLEPIDEAIVEAILGSN